MPLISRGELEQRLAGGQGLRGINLVRAELSGMSLSRADLSKANLRMANLSQCDLTDASLAGCSLSGADLSDAILVGVNFVEATLIGTSLRRANLSRADLSGADLTGADLEDARLHGTYLVGAFLNETSLIGAKLSGAYIRMAQMGGVVLTNACLDSSDLSNTDLGASRLDGCSFVGANLHGANLRASTLAGCDMRGADLTGADLTGCHLTGARLGGVKFPEIKLDDAWAEWVDIGDRERGEIRASLEEAFPGTIGKPLAQIVVEGNVSDDVWALVLAHLLRFRLDHPEYQDVKLKALHQGFSSSAIFLEADSEWSLAAYMGTFADIMGKGSVQLFEQLSSISADAPEEVTLPPAGYSAGSAPGPGTTPKMEVLSGPLILDLPALNPDIEWLERTLYWAADKAVAILTGERRIWLQAVSTQSLTLRPPRGSSVRIDVVRGNFLGENGTRLATARGDLAALPEEMDYDSAGATESVS